MEKYSAILNKVMPQIPDKNTIAEIHNVHALRHILRKEYPLAKVQLDNGIALAKKENAGDALGNLYHSYARFYFTQNKIKEGEDYSYKYDSLQRAANLKELNFYLEDLGVQYETAKKENLLELQHVQLKQKNSLIYFLSAGAIALLAISLLSYRNYHHRQKLQQAKIDELETEKQLTATEVGAEQAAVAVAAAEATAVAVSSAQHSLQYEQRAVADYEQKMSDMACSLDNPDACEACGS